MGGVASAPMVGRDRELARVALLLDDALQLVLAEPVVRAAGDDPSRADLWSRLFGNAERPRPADSADSGRAQRFALFAEVRRRLAEAARPDGLLPRLSADASTERLDLHGLPAGAVGDMLLTAGLPASPDQVGEVHSETGGNPFLVRNGWRGRNG